MFEEITLLFILLLSISYVVYRIVAQTKKKEACEKCELMDAVKKAGDKG